MDIGLREQAAVDFVLALRRRWADTLYPHLRSEFVAAGGDASQAPAELAPLVRSLSSYGWFAWLERGSQKMLWRACIDTAQAQGAGGPSDAGEARFDPSFPLPQWYTDWDIHLQPGGVWSSAASAQVYELGAKLVMMGDNDDYKFHRLFAQTALPHRPWSKIVDLGCGFGKSTWALKSEFPAAEVVGVDLSAPCLDLAIAKSRARGLAIDFRQADATASGLDSGAFDLVTSTMLAHELPLAALPALFAEAARLLAPGGVLAFLDFQPTGDGFRDLAMIEHSSRNNEPFMAPMMAADLIGMAERAGLANARWTAFDERAAGALEGARWPARAEWHFPWAVLHADKPA
ncbi:MAG TPA: class I SAM-dependent methyltransferase [Caulobacteraceae bacterium]